jgi:cation:H+ antiporter
MRIADFLNWKKFIVASLVMGFVSSMPEFFVGISASLSGKPGLSFGNVIGSNVFLLTLVIGVAVLLGGKIKLKGKMIQRSLLFAGLYALLPLLLMIDGEASRGDGAILIVALVFYVRELVSAQRRFRKTFLGDQEEPEETAKQLKSFFKDLGIFLLGFGFMVLGAQAIVFSASRLALQFNLPLVLIGALGVALGTSLPELSFGIRSVIMKQKEMVLGNVFGSIAINSALVLGITCLIRPFRIYNSSLYVGAFIFTGIVVLTFLIFSKTGDEITKREARFLLFLYFLFFVIQLWLK